MKLGGLERHEQQRPPYRLLPPGPTRVGPATPLWLRNRRPPTDNVSRFDLHIGAGTVALIAFILLLVRVFSAHERLFRRKTTRRQGSRGSGWGGEG